MTFEARERRKLREMLFRNVILANKRSKTPRTKREIMQTFVRCVAKPNIINKEVLKRLGVTFLTEDQFRNLIKHGRIEKYDFNDES